MPTQVYVYGPGKTNEAASIRRCSMLVKIKREVSGVAMMGINKTQFSIIHTSSSGVSPARNSLFHKCYTLSGGSFIYGSNPLEPELYLNHSGLKAPSFPQGVLHRHVKIFPST